MEFEIIVENDYATIRYQPAQRYIYHTFHQPISGQPFRDTMNIALDALIERGATKWLSDDRKNGQFTPEDIEWALTEWGPRAAAGGWKQWALVVPEDVAGRAGMVEIVSMYAEMGVRLRIFSNVEQGREWLLN